MTTLPDPLTLPEAAEALGLSASTLRTQLQREHLKGTKRGRDWLISRREVERYRAVMLGGNAAPIRSRTRAKGKRAPKT